MFDSWPAAVSDERYAEAAAAPTESSPAVERREEQSYSAARHERAEGSSSQRALPAFQKLRVHRADARVTVRVSASERDQLETWARSSTRPHRTVVRSRIVLLASRGLTIGAIARRLHVSRGTVRTWCRRFAEEGLAALEADAPGRGRPPGMVREQVLAVLRAMRGVPARQRSARRIATPAGTSATTVWRVWKHLGLSGSSSIQEIDAALERLISESPRHGR